MSNESIKRIKFLFVLLTTSIVCLLTYHYFVRSTFIGKFLNGKKISNIEVYEKLQRIKKEHTTFNGKRKYIWVLTGIIHHRGCGDTFECKHETRKGGKYTYLNYHCKKCGCLIPKIPFEKWIRWIWPFIVVLFLLGFLLLIPTVTMELSGF